MKLVVFLAAVAVVVARSQHRLPRQSYSRGRQLTQPVQPAQTFPAADPNYRPIAIISDNRLDYGNGNFNYDFETENGIVVNAVGTPGSQGQSNIQGSFRFPLPDGTMVEVTYVADEEGYRAVSPFIPTPPPMPQHSLDQIRIAEEQRAQGITWDHQGFRLTR